MDSHTGPSPDIKDLITNMSQVEIFAGTTRYCGGFVAKVYKGGQLLTTEGDVDSAGNQLPAQAEGVDRLVQQAAIKGTLQISPHADERMTKRKVNIPEVMQAAKSCYRDRRNDRWNEDKGRWQYSLRGKTKDRRNITIGIELHAGTWVVTVIPK